MLIDTHCHVQFKAFDNDREQVISNCAKKNIIMNVVGTQSLTSESAVALAEKYDNIYATIGLHPIQKYVLPVKEENTSFIARGEVFDLNFYDKLISSSKKIIAIGETGLDAFHIPKDKSAQEIFEKQKETFLAHYELAQKYNLPLVIHVRDAHDQMLSVLSNISKPIKGVVHCFSGTLEYAEQYIDLGLYLGFTGIITFPIKKTDPSIQEKLWEIVRTIPLDKILIETDAPYLAPQEYRGLRCEPWMVEECAKKISELRGLSISEVSEVTINNSCKLFGIKK